MSERPQQRPAVARPRAWARAICSRRLALPFVALALLAVGGPAVAQTDAEELAKKLANPVASLISVPFQLNWDTGIGPDDRDQMLLNIQPVVPFSLGPKWTLIERVIVPVIDAPYGAGSGISDVTFQTFFSPQPSASGTIWGIGPVLVVPTASKDTLGTEKWSAGPTFVVLKQTGSWTSGILMMNVWSFAGDDDRADVNSGLLQPFVSRGMGGGLTLSASLDAAANWDADEEWTIPLNLGFSKVVRLGSQNASYGGALRYFVEKPEGGPDWGLRFSFGLLFPK